MDKLQRNEDKQATAQKRLEFAVKNHLDLLEQLDCKTMEDEDGRRKVIARFLRDITNQLHKKSTTKEKLKYLRAIKERHLINLQEATFLEKDGQMIYYNRIINEIIIPQEEKLLLPTIRPKNQSKKITEVSKEEAVTLTPNKKPVYHRFIWRDSNITDSLTDLLIKNKIVDEAFDTELKKFFKEGKVLTKIRLNVSRNVITTLFYFLHDTGILRSSKKFSSKAIFYSFTDKAGNLFKSSSSIYQDMKDNQADRRLKNTAENYPILYNFCY